MIEDDRLIINMQWTLTFDLDANKTKPQDLRALNKIGHV